MKTIQKTVQGFLLLIAIIGPAKFTTAQKPPSAKEVAIKNMVDSQRYVFYAQTANPSSGRQRTLTTEYTVKVLKDTIICDLPYFGRAYTAPMDATAGGVQFITTDFDYRIEPRKKGGWDVTIKPKDIQGGNQLSFTIFENGTSSAQATSNNRQPISFNGYIEAVKQKK